MNTADMLLRADLRDFAGYRSARSERLQGDVWLNANESAWNNPCDPDGLCRRYPPPQPDALLQRLAALYGVAPENVLAGRGSDEAIDLLLRAFCMPGCGHVVIANPVFGMYAVCARLHGATVIDVPLHDSGERFTIDLDAMANAALESSAALLFLCSPGNPTGDCIPLHDIRALARRMQGHALVVVDEAYLEFSNAESATTLLDECDNVVVLRTLSKAHALAGARIGVALAPAAVISALRRCQAPYPLPEPAVASALDALTATAVARTCEQVAMIVAERERMAAALATLPQVRRVYPSAANFLLLRFQDAQAAFDALLATGIVVRDMRAMPQLQDALRISIGQPAENQRVLNALAALRALAA